MIENQTIVQFPFIQWTPRKEANTVQLIAFHRSSSYYYTISKIPTLEGLGIGPGRVGELILYNFFVEDNPMEDDPIEDGTIYLSYCMPKRPCMVFLGF